MSIETPDQLNGMKRAAAISRLTLDALEAKVRVGITTAELDAVAATVLSKHGARSAPTLVYGFPGHVLLSINDADAARTVVVGQGSDIATRMVAVRAAFRAGLSVARAGTRVNQIGRAVDTEVRRDGFTAIRGCRATASAGRSTRSRRSRTSTIPSRGTSSPTGWS